MITCDKCGTNIACTCVVSCVITEVRGIRSVFYVQERYYTQGDNYKQACYCGYNVL